eukprot:scaffold672_cov126-Cylindrotheca_fusiformis.AAC.50
MGVVNQTEPSYLIARSKLPFLLVCNSGLTSDAGKQKNFKRGELVFLILVTKTAGRDLESSNEHLQQYSELASIVHQEVLVKLCHCFSGFKSQDSANTRRQSLTLSERSKIKEYFEADSSKTIKPYC